MCLCCVAIVAIVFWGGEKVGEFKGRGPPEVISLTKDFIHIFLDRQGPVYTMKREPFRYLSL